MLKVERDLWDAIENGLGEETQKEIAELEQFDSEIMYNGIIENLGDDAYADGVIATLVAIQKERTENEIKKTEENVKKFLVISGLILAGFVTERIVSKVKKYRKKKKEEAQND